MNDKSHSFPDYTYWQLFCIYQQSYSLLMIVACSALYIMILIFMLGSNENDWYNEKNNRYNEKNNKLRRSRIIE